MKIAILTRRIQNPGGAEESALEIKEYFSKDYECEVFSLFGDYNQERTPITEKIPSTVELKSSLRYIYSLKDFREISKFDPDVIIAQHELSLPAGIYCSRNDCRQIIFFRDEGMRHVTGFSGSNWFNKLVNGFCTKFNNKIVSLILRNSEEAVGDSNYISQRYSEVYDKEFRTIYEFVDLNKYKVDETGNKILHVNPSINKGIELTLDVAKSLPDEEFIVVGNSPSERIRKRIESIDNVDFQGYVEDMRDVYEESKLVLMPSQWNEPYGRIPIESGASGIPTISSDKGGLPESNHDELTVGNQNSESYLEKVNEVLNNYKLFSSFAKENAEAKSLDSEIKKLERLL